MTMPHAGGSEYVQPDLTTLVTQNFTSLLDRALKEPERSRTTPLASVVPDFVDSSVPLEYQEPVTDAPATPLKVLVLSVMVTVAVPDTLPDVDRVPVTATAATMRCASVVVDGGSVVVVVVVVVGGSVVVVVGGSVVVVVVDGGSEVVVVGGSVVVVVGVVAATASRIAGSRA